jgi:hypothetical protein
LAGFRRIAYSWSTLSVRLADRSSAAMPATAGVAALVPRKVVNRPGTDVLTASGPATSGFCRSSGVASGVPFTSKRRVTVPRELYGSGVVGVAAFAAATGSAPRAAPASVAIVPEPVACSMLTVPTPLV